MNNLQKAYLNQIQQKLQHTRKKTPPNMIFHKILNQQHSMPAALFISKFADNINSKKALVGRYILLNRLVEITFQLLYCVLFWFCNFYFFCFILFKF